MILLDDAQSTAAKPSSRHYESPLQYWRVVSTGDNALDLSATENCLTQITTSLNRGEFVVAAFAYELGRQIHRLPQRVGITLSTLSTHPLIEAWSFKSLDKLSKAQVDALIADHLALLDADQNSAGVLDVRERQATDGRHEHHHRRHAGAGHLGRVVHRARWHHFTHTRAGLDDVGGELHEVRVERDRVDGPQHVKLGLHALLGCDAVHKFLEPADQFVQHGLVEVAHVHTELGASVHGGGHVRVHAPHTNGGERVVVEAELAYLDRHAGSSNRWVPAQRP